MILLFGNFNTWTSTYLELEYDTDDGVELPAGTVLFAIGVALSAAAADDDAPGLVDRLGADVSVEPRLDPELELQALVAELHVHIPRARRR